MSEAVAERNFDAAIKDIGDKIVGLSLIQAKELADYLKDTYGIEPAAGGAVMAMPMAGGDGGAAAAAEKTEFNVVIKSGGDQKLKVIKVVRSATGLGLKEEAKALVDEAPKTLLEGVSKEDADKWAKELQDAGAQVEIS
ncbi:MAG: 50S ribosomal protein L7/L12 [Phycisphaerales bacterium]|nr:50S ribosomal protein L7/L12 [Phycisphaerales bacterium]